MIPDKPWLLFLRNNSLKDRDQGPGSRLTSGRGFASRETQPKNGYPPKSSSEPVPDKATLSPLFLAACATQNVFSPSKVGWSIPAKAAGNTSKKSALPSTTSVCCVWK